MENHLELLPQGGLVIDAHELVGGRSIDQRISGTGVIGALQLDEHAGAGSLPRGHGFGDMDWLRVEICRIHLAAGGIHALDVNDVAAVRAAPFALQPGKVRITGGARHGGSDECRRGNIRRRVRLFATGRKPAYTDDD